MGTLTLEQERALREGVQLDDGMARATSLADAGGEGANHWYKLTLPEGRNREVRRLFEALGLMVSRLIRTRYGVVAMPPQLKRGQTVELEHDELSRLLQAAGMGQGGAEGGRDGNAVRQQATGEATDDAGQEADDANGNGADASPGNEDSDEAIDDVDGNRAPPPPSQPRAARPQEHSGHHGGRGNRGRNRGGHGGGNRGGSGGGSGGNRGGNRGGSPGGYRGGNDSGGR
jgi:23S rRNA pseudouridine2605 synthase